MCSPQQMYFRHVDNFSAQSTESFSLFWLKNFGRLFNLKLLLYSDKFLFCISFQCCSPPAEPVESFSCTLPVEVI